MIIKLLPDQIPLLWSAIKFAVVKTDRLNGDRIPGHLNQLLTDLLNDKAQCFIRLDDERHLLAIGITRFNQDMMTGEKILLFSNLYSFKNVGADIWKIEIEFIKDFARQAGCKKIVFHSGNDKVFQIARVAGFRERYRCFSMEV